MKIICIHSHMVNIISHIEYNKAHSFSHSMPPSVLLVRMNKARIARNANKMCAFTKRFYYGRFYGNAQMKTTKTMKNRETKK